MIDMEGLRAAIANAVEALEEVALQLPAPESEEIQQRTAADVGRQPIGDPPPDEDDDDDDEEEEDEDDEDESAAPTMPPAVIYRRGQCSHRSRRAPAADTPWWVDRGGADAAVRRTASLAVRGTDD